MVLWTIVQIDEQGLDVRKAFFDGLPPGNQTIHEAITGHFGRHPIEKKLIGGGKKYSHGRYGSYWLKVMVDGFRWNAALSPSCKGSDVDRCLGIDREAQSLLIGIGLLVHLLHLGKDCVGFGQFFWAES
jgi:hypothetical protein